MTRLAALALLLGLVACSPADPAGPATAAAEPVRAEVQNDPGAAAAFFPAPDRPVAEIVSATFNDPAKRDAADESGQIARILNIRPGMVVGDIGAGSGYHTVRLSRVVGPTGRIIAQDIKPDYLRGLARTLDERGITNVTLAVGEAHDPRLAPGSIDVALLAHMYHEIGQPYAFLYNLAPALKPGARVAIVDTDKPTHLHGTPMALLRCELAAVGYREVGMTPLQGDLGYVAVFAPPAPDAMPQPGEIRPCRLQSPR
jgi:predicted methyltransferase